MTTTTYAADRSALLIVDPYNDFMNEGGKFYEATRETAEAVGFYDNMRRLIPAIRAAAIRVIVVPHRRWRPDDYEGWTHMNASQAGVQEMQLFAAGTWGGRPTPNDARPSWRTMARPHTPTASAPRISMADAA